MLTPVLFLLQVTSDALAGEALKEPPLLEGGETAEARRCTFMHLASTFVHKIDDASLHALVKVHDAGD